MEKGKHKVTGASQVIPQPITNAAHPGLSCQIGRDGELYRRYEPCIDVRRFSPHLYHIPVVCFMCSACLAPIDEVSLQKMMFTDAQMLSP